MNLKERLVRVPTRLVLGAGVAVVLWAAGGFLVVPRIVLSKLPPALSAKLHRPVTLKGTKANPFTLSVTLEGLTVGEKEGPGTLLSVERIFVNAEGSSLFHRGVVLSEVVVEAPVLSVARTGEGAYSVSDLIEEFSKEEPGRKPARFAVANIRVERGTVRFDDRPERTKHEVTELKVGIPFLSDLPVDQEVFTEPFLGAKVNGSAFALKGRTKPFSGTRETTLDIDLEDVDLPFYRPYVPLPGDARLSSGRLDTKLALSFRKEKEGPAVVLSGSATLREILFADSGKAPLAGVKRLEAVLDSVYLLRKKVKVASVTVDSPELWIVREKGGGYPIAEKFLGKAPEKHAGAKGGGIVSDLDWGIEVASVSAKEGKLHYRDEQPRRPFVALVQEIAVSVSGVSTGRGKAASVKASAVTDGGERIEQAGTFTLLPEAVEGTVTISGVPLKRYASYTGELVRFGFESGTADLSMAYRWPVAGFSTALSSVTVAVKDVKARKTGEKEDFLSVPSATVYGASLDPEKLSFQAGTVTVNGPALRVARGKDGGIDLARLMIGAKEGAAAAPAPAGEEKGPAWTARLASLAVEKGSVRFVDEAAPRPVTFVVSGASLKASGLSTARGERGRIEARAVVNGKGKATVAGTVAAVPVVAELKTDLQGLDLTPLAAYFPERVKLSLEGGALSAKGLVSARELPDGSYSLGYAGDATVAKLRTVDPATAEEFLAWNSLFVGGMNATWNPLSFSASKVSATDLVARIVLYEDGTLNARRLLGLDEPPPVDDAAAEAATGGVAAAGAAASGSAAAEAAAGGTSARTAAAAVAPAASAGSSAAPAEVPPVRIDAVTLQGATLHVHDRFVKPSYRAEMREVGGRISGLSSVAGTRAEIDLRGKLESSAPLEIAGTVNPFSAVSFADIKASFRDIDLVPMTPYFVKYAGYSVQKGRLTMTVAYKLDDRKLTAQNAFVVDQFTFGEKVESPTATKLPVKLAVSLLKDPDGVIRLDVPISGSVDDPKFRVGPIVWKILGNILVKAVRSPFALLGSLFGGGKELSFVDFTPGSSRLDVEAASRVDALAAALVKRPALKLEVEGKADAVKDAEGLRRVLYERKVKARKAEELAKGGTPAASVDEVAVSKEEWPEYLKRAYKKESFPKPRTALGFVKEIPPDEMEKLMLTNVAVSPDDLRQLALARAEGVSERLLGLGKVPPDRVFLVDPAPAAEAKPGEPLTRAAFTLK